MHPTDQATLAVGKLHGKGKSYSQLAVDIANKVVDIDLGTDEVTTVIVALGIDISSSVGKGICSSRTTFRVASCKDEDWGDGKDERIETLHFEGLAMILVFGRMLDRGAKNRSWYIGSSMPCN